MATNQDPQSAQDAGKCTVKWSQDFPPPTATAKSGALRLKVVPITNIVLFVPAACSVKEDGGADITLTANTPSALSFPVQSGKTYKLTVAYLSAPPGHPASAKLQEDCADADGGIIVDQTTV